MNKYVIELRPDCKVVQQICESDGQVSIGAKNINYLEELNSDYINEHYGDLQDEAYKRGLEDGKHTAVGAAELREKLEYQRGLSEGNDIGYKDGVNDGRNEAWEAARKIAQQWEEDTDTEHRLVIDDSISVTLDSMTASEAIEKLKAYEEEQKADDKIKVGDEVEVTENGIKFFVTKIYEEDGTVGGFNKDGEVRYWSLSLVKPTGRHFDITSILEEMRHD